MEQIKTGFIKPNNEVVSLEYYELEAYCRKEIENYIMEDKSKYSIRLEQFKKFSKEYTYFRPYLDFVLFQMKYIQINPFFMKGYLGYTEGEQFFIKECTSFHYGMAFGEGAFYFNRASDKNYHICNGAIIENGMIDVNGNVLELFSFENIDENAWGHPGLSSMILNQYCSFSKMICDDFQSYFLKNHPNMYTMYLMEKLGFGQVTKRRGHNLIYLNPNLITKKQLDVAYAVREYYGNDILTCTGKKEDSSIKKYVKEIWGDVYENR